MTRTIGTTLIIKYIKRQRLKWLCHIMRMNPMPPATRPTVKLETTRGSGRPKRRIKGVADTLRHQNIIVTKRLKI
jgi:hypothetical protein